MRPPLFHRAWLAAGISVMGPAGIVSAEEAPPAHKRVQDFLGTYCIDCHDKETEKGDREFESFALPLKSVADLISAKEIIDQITLKEMPPKKADQPTDDERLEILRVLREGS